MLFGVAVNVTEEEFPEHTGFVPVIAILAVAVGFTVRTTWSETSGQETLPGCWVLEKVRVIVPMVIVGV